jgi:spore maturation protein CgeB
MNVALIGKFTGESWRMEAMVQRALWALGHDVQGVRIPSLALLQDDVPEGLGIDEVYRWLRDQQHFGLGGIQDVDLTLVIQGYGLLAEAIEEVRARTPRPVVCWHGEVLGDHWPTADEVVRAKVAQLEQNVAAYDLVIHNCRTSLGVLTQLGAQRVACVPVSGVDPEMHRRMDVPKAVDVGIYGWPSQRRYDLVQAVIERLPEGTTYAWPNPNDPGSYGEGLMTFINRSRVLLNVRFNETLNTETRLYESLGCGTPVVSEPISMPELFPDGVGITYGASADALAAAIERILGMPADEYRGFADMGYEWVHQRYSYRQRCQEVLDVIAKELG